MNKGRCRERKTYTQNIKTAESDSHSEAELIAECAQDTPRLTTLYIPSPYLASPHKGSDLVARHLLELLNHLK